MTRRKLSCSKWILVLVVVLVCPFVYSRPQEPSSSTSAPINDGEKPTEQPTRKENPVTSTTSMSSTTEVNSPRDVKTKGPIIGDSIKMVASQLLETSNKTSESSMVLDTRIPPKVKNQVKNKVKTKNEDSHNKFENGHAGIAVPITMEELETENKLIENPNESSTSNEGISTWILLSNPTSKDNTSVSTEATKVAEPQKKQKINPSKNKTKRPLPSLNKPASKRPIIGSVNKSDLVAGGSAINDNVFNKIKDTVLSNVQKNKSTTQKTSTTTTTTTTSTTAAPLEQTATLKKEEVTKAPMPVIKVTSKPSKKKNKVKQKATTTTTTTTEEPYVNESALLPMEAKEQEIELEISTPATTTKKPKRSSTKKKKNKTKKRKTSTKIDTTSLADVKKTEVKTSNKTKTNKHSTKKPDSPITTQIFSYLSREVMPSVGVGVIGLAGLVGLASYFLYPFATPVRRTFEVDKKDDLYRHNAEEYASEGNGQAEEEMLGTVLAGMPAHSKHKLNPYMGQMAQAHTNRYPTKKEQDIKYRHVASSYESPNYNVHYPQQKTGIAHGAVYSEPSKSVQYPQQYDTRHTQIYTTESKYTYDNAAYTPYPAPAVEPIYAVPQTGLSDVSGYGNDAGNSVVYGVKPSADSDFKPVYPFEGQVFSETTNSPMTYPPTSMYLGSNSETEQKEHEYSEEEPENEETDNKFVVGNIPKELVDSATPAVVPEHGPRNLSRRKRGIAGSIEEILKAAKTDNKDIFISNEIDEALGDAVENLAPMIDFMNNTATSLPEMNDVKTNAPVQEDVSSTVIPVYGISMDIVDNDEKLISSTDSPTTTIEDKIIESVSTLPIDNYNSEKAITTTEADISNELDGTTKSFRVYEVFSSPSTKEVDESSSIIENIPKETDTTTESRKFNTETTTTELKPETTSTMPSTETSAPTAQTKQPEQPISSPKPTNNPNVITYPPINGEGSFFTFLKRLIEFKYRLGVSILQSTSESLNRYLRSMESTVQKVARASQT